MIYYSGFFDEWKALNNRILLKLNVFLTNINIFTVNFDYLSV